jgi:hypothetical protein
MLPVLAKQSVKSQRRVSDLYAVQGEETARAFRRRLDRRLHDRYREPVVWETAPPPAHRPAA